jgi:hypothetical protein
MNGYQVGVVKNAAIKYATKEPSKLLFMRQGLYQELAKVSHIYPLIEKFFDHAHLILKEVIISCLEIVV